MRPTHYQYTVDFMHSVRSSETYLNNPLFRQFADIVFKRLDIDLLYDVDLNDMALKLNEAFELFIQSVNENHCIIIKPFDIGKGEAYKNSIQIFIHMYDCPYIIDSILEYLNDKGIQLLSFIHPVISVESDGSVPVALSHGNNAEESNHSFSWFITTSVDKSLLDTLYNDLKFIAEALTKINSDMAGMKELMYELSKKKSEIVSEDIRTSEGRQLFKWMLNDNVFLLGTGALPEYKLETFSKWQDFENLKGMFKLAEQQNNENVIKHIYHGLTHFSRLKQVFNLVELPYASPVYKRSKIILCMHKGTSAEGQQMFFIFPLIFTHASLHFKPTEIPIARLKVSGVFDKLEIVRDSHNFRNTENFFMQFPRSEIFRMDREELEYIIKTIHKNAWKSNQVAVFFYYRKQQNYLHITTVLPVSNFFPKTRSILKKLFLQEFRVKANYDYRFEYMDKIHIHFVYWGDTLKNVPIEENKLAEKITLALTVWDDRLWDIVEQSGSAELKQMVRPGGEYNLCFRDNYKVEYPPETAFLDLQYLLKVLKRKELQVFFEHLGQTQSIFTIYSNEPVQMRHTINMLEKCSMFVTNYNKYSTDTSIPQYLYRYEITHRNITNDPHFQERINETFCQLTKSDVETDPIYALVAFPGMNIQAIKILKIYRDYFIQINHSYRLVTLNETLIEYSMIAQMLKEYFILKFSPEGNSLSYENENHLIEIKECIIAELNNVESLSADYILRVFMSLITATVRTNIFQPNNNVLAIKIDCSKSEYISQPKMMYEIFVQDDFMQGIHIRGGKIARGGIRFSDRPDDLRVEIMNLAQAQMLKNAVIVPLGSKGGYSISKKWANREEMIKDSEFYYRRYIRALLSITDNIVDEQTVAPAATVRYDNDDPYFVVAADKGTASYSDIANEISQDFNFWLGDAFASGGSSGYGHKSLAITAKGAWECVKLHFRESGKNIDQELFTVVGIGDMSGDVFGNGMLLSENIKLVGAFNHMHIFIDPNPDPLISFEERSRLFRLPFSTWKNYDASKISQGGGIFDRQAKTIMLTSEMKIMLETELESMSGIELIRSLLKLDVELLWNGGIGTYVKATHETNLEVGDNHNNDVRVNGCEVRAKIIGEGGNLGVSPKGRIEYEYYGGRINADSIDNSAGVDLSDHEVNIKILLRQLAEKGLIKNKETRDNILSKLSGDMVDLCLQDNIDNSLMISMDQQRTLKNMGFFIAEIEHLENREGLNRSDANIPSNKELNVLYQENRPMPRSTLAVISGFTKNYIYKRLVDSDVPDQEIMHSYFETYFPTEIQKICNLKETSHRLEREIISMRLSNYFVNTGGVTFIAELANMTRRRSFEIVMGFMIIDKLFDGLEMGKLIRSIPHKHNDKIFDWMYQKEMMFKREIIWLLTNLNPKEITFALVEKYRSCIIDIQKETLNKISADRKNAIREVFESVSVKNDEHFNIENILLIFEQKNYLETANLILSYGLNTLDSEYISEEVETLFSFNEIEKRVSAFKTSSNWEITHLGLIINRINQIRKAIYNQILSDKKDEQPTTDCIDQFLNTNQMYLQSLNVFKNRVLVEETYILSSVTAYLYELESSLLH